MMGLCAPHALAQWTDKGAEPHEVAQLPKYCFSRMMRNSNEDWKYWTAVMGPMYEHIHHYCRGMVLTNRAKNPQLSKIKREAELQYSIGEFDYVIRLAPRTFVLLPEILSKKAENLFKINQPAPATSAALVAIEVKPDYWPAYAAMSDGYKRMGDVKNARQWLEKGLAAAPDSKALSKRLSELGGGSGKAETARPAAAAAKPRPATPEASADDAAAKPGPLVERPAPKAEGGEAPTAGR